jgi:hypothetical protein
VCVCIPTINFWMPEPIFMKLGMYIMAPEPIATAYFINSPPSVCVSVCVYAPHRCWVNTFPWQWYIKQQKNCWTRRFLCGSCIKGECVCLCNPLSLIDNISINTFPRKRIFGSAVFYVVRFVSKGRRRLDLPRTSVTMK